MKKFIVVLAILCLAALVVAEEEVYEHTKILEQVKSLENKKIDQMTPEERDVWTKYHTVGAPTVVQRVDGFLEDPLTDKAKLLRKAKTNDKGKVSLSAISIDEIINIGKEVWKVINDNKPVVQTDFDSGNALPKGVTAATDLSNWSAPKVLVYEVTWSNGFGMNVVTFDYRVSFTYDGEYQGVGKYLTACKIDSKTLDVSWGYTFEASGKVISVTNVGSSDQPIAGMQLELSYTVKTVIKSSQESAVYYVRGDGTIKSM